MYGLRRSTAVAILVLVAVACLAASGPVAAGAAPSAGPPLAASSGGDALVLPASDASEAANPLPGPAEQLRARGSAAASASQQDVVHEHLEYRLLPDEPRWIEVDATYELPSEADQLSVLADDPDVRVADADGFEERSGDEWAWDGTTETPSVTVQVELTTNVRERTWVAYGTADWAIAERPPLGLASDVPTTDREIEWSVDGEGVAGTDLVYLGAHETYEAETENERIVLVVPESVTLPDSPEEVVALIAHASERLEVGSRPETVFHGFVVPDDVDAGLLGRNLGTDALYFNRFQLDTADGVWVHEYVHARQNFHALTEETRWLSEGSADYYEPLYVMERGHVGFDQFRAELERGRESPFDEVVVSDPDTWQGPAVRYTHGALVAAAIDREIREHSDGDASFQDVVAAWNEADRFDQDAFLDAVEDAGGPEARERARELTETSTLPETWDYETHERLFEVSVPETVAGDGGDSQVTTEVPAGVDFTVDGPYRTGSIDDGAVAVGETVTVEVWASNQGQVAGEAETALTVDGEVVDSDSVAVAPGDTEAVELATTLEEPGEYELSAADTTTTVTVHERGELSLASADVSSADEGATVEVELAAGDAGLAVGEYEVATADGTLADGAVALSAGETRTVTASVPAGVDEVTITAAGETRTVDVPADAGDDGLPGFGPLPALVALLLAGGGLAARRR